MRESAERVQYITEYIVSYQAKIESLNKKGLFDTATLYEIFAQKICGLWFGQRFYNLNEIKANFPYVDLISEDKKIYVQVSTIQDVPAKVKSTLEKIRDSKSSELQNVTKLFFFVLSNESVGRVKDYTGASRIGNIDFIRDENLITSDNVVQKAKTDIDFQIALYDFLQSENDSLVQIGEKFETAVSLSKALISNNIDHYINGEYVIDRSKEITQIVEEKYNFISVQGEAGSGKSALCKIMLENEELVLYARAEKISEARSIDDIWELDLKKIVKYINDKKLVIYIDALEFIADAAKTKLDLLQQIYETVKEHNNIYVVTSCRTCDRTAFVKIENIYHIQRYEVSLLTDNQILEVAKKYKIVQELWDAKVYIQLLRSPFYLNLLIKEIKDFRKIDDVDGFRNYIWTEVMCLGGKKLPQGLTHSDIRNAVEKIVLDRARKFLVGVRKRDIGEEIATFLLSENVVTLCTDDTVRLKYDIFEDICFERYIDELYDDCKNDYDVFFSSIEPLGRCIYRRYQIWVENKLFTKGNREKFLYKLLETNRIPDDWKTQTIVGIVKSNFCRDFFDEYKDYIVGDLLWNFTRLTNNFAFEVSILTLKYKNVYSQLKPIGMGRPCLINLLYECGVYKESKIENQILKLCSDYSQSFIYNNVAVDSACKILEFYVEQKMENALEARHFHLSDELNECLLPIYRMAEKSKDWIKQFWGDRISGYLKGDKTHHLDEDIIEFVLKSTVPALAMHLPNELCEMADAYWIEIPESDKKDLYYYSSPLDRAEEYGLSSQANSYTYDYQSVLDNTFLNVLIQYNWVVALNWLIRLTNHVADSIKQSHPECVYDISVWLDSPEEQISFICNPDFWLVGIQEHRINELIGDGVYLFTKMVINEINDPNNDKQIVRKFAEYIKSEIIKKANNVIMLSIIAEIGRNCEKVIPGYSLFLASSIDLVMIDSQKIRILLPNEDIQLYEKLILMSVGIPELNKRYDIVVKEDSSLQGIVMKLQLLGEEYRVKSERILDYLYSIIPNQGEDARIHLQIQKMDVRNATMSRIDERTIAITPEIKGDAKKIVEENAQSKYNRDKNSFQKIIDNCNSLMSAGTFEIQDCFDTIDQLQRLIISADAPGQLQKVLVMMISYALSKEELTVEKRSQLCSIWLDGIDSILDNDTFAFDYVLLKILYKQNENELTIEIKEKMRKQMLECLLYRGHQGIISNISMQIKEYLLQNTMLAKCFFNTIVALAEDRMAEYRYNASKLCNIGKDVNYQPNRSTPPTWVKEIFREHRIDLYSSKKESIIESYLFQENTKDFSKWSIETTDIQTLCYISGCGLSFGDNDFSIVMKTMFANMMSVISVVEKYHNFLDVYSISEVKNFINNSLVRNQNVPAVLDMLFELPDFTEMNSDAYELYEDIASHLLAVYFDGHNSPEVRRQCEVILNGIENKLLNIADIKTRNKLYSMMFLTLGKFHMHDWKGIYTSYEYRDKVFLNKLWGKYGWLHFGNLLRVIDQMHITELLPEVLVSLDESLNKYKQEESACERVIKKNEVVINKIITKAFLDFNDKIKADREFTHAFESFLESLVDFSMEEAAVILDEFRIH